MNTNRVLFDDHEQLIFDDLARMQTDAGRHLMDLLLTMHQGYNSGGNPIPAVLGGFDVTDVTGRDITIGEGIGFCFERISGDDDGESRARLIQIQPARGAGESTNLVIIPQNPSIEPRFVLIYATPTPEMVLSEPRHRLNPATGLVESVNMTKWTIASAHLDTEEGENATIPAIPDAWNPLVGAVDRARLPLYAVYCPPLMLESATVERGNIIDLRYQFSPSGQSSKYSSSFGQAALDRNPVLQTSYLSSQDEGADNDAIDWEATAAVFRGQHFQVQPGSSVNPWTATWTYSYCCDETMRYSANRFSRPIYWYALPPIGVSIARRDIMLPTIVPLSSRYGLVTCLDKAPNNGNRLGGSFTLRCGDDLDHKYTLETHGLFMGSLVVGRTSEGDQRVYGCKRDGDKVMFTEREIWPDDVEFKHLVNPTEYGYGIPLGGYQREDDGPTAWQWDPTRHYQIDPHKTPIEGAAARILPYTARGITLGGGLQITTQVIETVTQRLWAVAPFLTTDMNFEDRSCPGYYFLTSYRKLASGDEAGSENTIHLPFPWRTERKIIFQVKGEYVYGEMAIYWWTQILGYDEPLAALETVSYPS